MKEGILIQASDSEKEINIRHLNNFDFLRFLGAIFVIISHSFNLLRLLGPIVGDVSLGIFGVFFFFIISGYLITKSWESDPSLLRFLWKRYLRLIPGLLGVILFTIFVIGPLATTLPLYKYYFNSETWDYFKVISIYNFREFLPGVFESNPLPNAINGVLWTFPYTVSFYIFFIFLGILKIFKKKFLVLILYIVLIIFYFILYFSPSVTVFYFISSIGRIFLSFLIYFLGGSVYYLYRDRITYNYKLAILFLGILVALAILDINNIYSIFHYASFLLLPYILLFFAFLPNQKLNNFGKYGEFSFGLFIYSFPIQQTIIHFYNGVSPIELIFLSIIFTLPVAILSSRFIESKALKLKNIDFMSKFRKMNDKKQRLP